MDKNEKGGNNEREGKGRKGKMRTGIRKEKEKIKENGNKFKETGEELKVGRNEKMKSWEKGKVKEKGNKKILGKKR